MTATVFQVAALTVALIAAALCLAAAVAKVESGKPGDYIFQLSPKSSRFVVDGFDLPATLRRQGRWNAFAAAATAISIVLQGFALFLA